MNEKIKEILVKHYGQILTELEELVDTDTITLTIEVVGDDFACCM